ncbi:MAG: tRNA pseudouridine(55) synthase TruB [Cellulomonas sp.]|nr:tRNA pseudouridine(55) synthase TruB [Cellulomonas sp.]
MPAEPRTRPDEPRRPTASDGIVVVDKPAGWTSHDVVARMRRLAGTRRVGHAGTLDPMATGVLVVGVGRATRLLTYITGADKEYLATVRLGEATTTDDAEGQVLTGGDASGLSREDVVGAAGPLTGDIEQIPSAVSAIKVDGVRAYARVRAGQAVALAARPVHVAVFEVGDLRPVGQVTDVDVRVVCSSGTYVRALARDLGAALGVGGHLTRLRRTRVGGFGLAEARTLDDLAATDPTVPLPVVSPAAAAGAVMATRAVTDAEARELGFGRRIARRDEPEACPVAAIAADGTLVAVLTVTDDRLRPVLVLAPA